MEGREGSDRRRSLEWHRLHRRMACFSNMHQNRVWSPIRFWMFRTPCGPKPRNTKMVLRCLKDHFGSLLSRYQGHTSQVSWIAAGLRALRPCRNKPEQTGWHKFFFSPSGAQTLLVSPGWNCLSSTPRLRVGKCPENPTHGSKQNVNHAKNSRWNLSTAEFGRRINLSKGIEVMLQAPSDPLALTGHGSCWIQRMSGPTRTRKLRNSCEKPKSSSAHRHYPDQVRQVRQIRIWVHRRGWEFVCLTENTTVYRLPTVYQSNTSAKFQESELGRRRLPLWSAWASSQFSSPLSGPLGTCG